MLAFRPSDTSPYTNYYVDITMERVGNTTTLTVALDVVLANSATLAEGVTREAQFYIGGQKVATQLIKPALTVWTGGSTYNFLQTIDVYNPETLASERWMKILILPASGSEPASECLWSNPDSFVISLPARPITVLNVPTVSVEKTIVLPSESIRVTWTPPTDPVTDYELMSRTSLQADWVPLAVTADLQYIDTDLPPRGQQKRYSIRSRLAGDPVITSDWATTAAVTVKPLPDQITGIRLSVSQAPVGWPVQVTYPAISGAVAYEAVVKQGSVFFNNQQILGRSTTTTLDLETSLLEAGKDYLVCVRAIDSYGEAGLWSTQAIGLSMRERVFESFDDAAEPFLAGGEYIKKAGDAFQTVGLKRIMRQLKQLDLYRAKYIGPDIADSARKSWCFHGGKQQSWSGSTLTMTDPKSGISKKLLKIDTSRTVNINTTTYSTFSFAPVIRYDRISDLLVKHVKEEIIQVVPALRLLTGREPLVDSTGIYVTFGSEAQHLFMKGTGSATIPKSEFSLQLGKLIDYTRSIFPLTYVVGFNNTSYLAPGNEHGVVAFQLDSATLGTVTKVSITARFGPSAWGANPTTQELANFFGNTHGIEYIKFDSINVFSYAPYQYVTVSPTHENNVRALAEEFFGISEQMVLWSDGKHRALDFDTISQAWLPAFYEEFPQLVSGCKTCDIFTCQCNGLHYGRVYCTACHSSGGSGADAGNPCTRCFTSRYSYTYATCPGNIVTNCKCGYGSNTKCNGNTCKCNGSRHLLGYI